MLLAACSLLRETMQTKTVYGNYEVLIDHARILLKTMQEKDTMDVLKNRGLKPEMAYLVVKAANILSQPYTYKEKKQRIVKSEDL
tara:strand:+ start:221 stop:475 length:255 start_codon:yes stop_codon:yes gene_type:complete